MQKKGDVVDETVQNDQGWAIYNNGTLLLQDKTINLQEFLSDKTTQDVINYCKTMSKNFSKPVSKWEGLINIFFH